MSTFKTAADAAVAFTTGKTDKATLLNYAKTLDMIGVLTLLEAKALTIDEASPLLKTGEAAPAQEIYFKVSEKGAISVYRLQKQFPVTLYADQWEKILNKADEMRKFIADNKAKLSVKPAKKS